VLLASPHSTNVSGFWSFFKNFLLFLWTHLQFEFLMDLYLKSIVTLSFAVTIWGFPFQCSCTGVQWQVKHLVTFSLQAQHSGLTLLPFQLYLSSSVEMHHRNAGGLRNRNTSWGENNSRDMHVLWYSWRSHSINYPLEKWSYCASLEFTLCQSWQHISVIWEPW
jgi:hypothetical protein